jgi:hypothetical protein
MHNRAQDWLIVPVYADWLKREAMKDIEPQHPQHKDGSLLKGLLIGGVVGSVTAWLLAPCSGTQLRVWAQTTMCENLAKTRSTIHMLLPGSKDRI